MNASFQMNRKKLILAVLLAVLCLGLSGCRTRTGSGGQVPEDSVSGTGEPSVILADAGPEENSADEQEKNGDPGSGTKENPEARRKEYDEAAPAEIVPGAALAVHGSGEGEGLSGSGENADQSAAKLNENAEKPAVQTAAAEEAEQKGVSPDAEEADSAMTYYTVLLQDRMGSLFECQRLNVYWETKEDRTTVFKTSVEHSLILNAGAYDVSARLLESNLRVDDGWIGRKNPGVVVKTVDRSVLGTGVVSEDAARRICAEMLARDGWPAMDAVRNRRVLLLSEELLEAPHLQLAAMLMIAKTANPDQFADVDIGSALAMLAEEAAGSIPAGIFYYSVQGGL